MRGKRPAENANKELNKKPRTLDEVPDDVYDRICHVCKTPFGLVSHSFHDITLYLA